MSLKYEKPLIVPLNSARDETGLGLCKVGQTDVGDCGQGNNALGKCKPGNAAAG